MKDEVKREQSATTIVKWWRRYQDSNRRIELKPRNVHPNFNRFLNNVSGAHRRLTLTEDRLLLKHINAGNWAEIAKDQNVHSHSLNLFLRDQITWEQKATISHIIESSKEYGAFDAYLVLTPEGEFTPEAIQYLLPFLKKSYTSKNPVDFSEQEINKIKEKVRKLPVSEQTIFVFKDYSQSFSYLDDDNLTENVKKETILLGKLFIPSIFRTDVRENEEGKEISVKTYVLASFSVENILGKVEFKKENWWTLLPTLGSHSIDDIDKFSKAHCRPTVSPDSIEMGLAEAFIVVHGVNSSYSSQVFHDTYHRIVSAVFGNTIHLAVERLITISRDTFGYRWSKDIWLFRDYNLISEAANQFIYENVDKLLKRDKLFTSRLFGICLERKYFSHEISNCDPEMKRVLSESPILSRSGNPTQIALALVIDMVCNPSEWAKLNIVLDEVFDKKTSRYHKLFEVAKMLKSLNIFTDDMKKNIIKFMYIIRNVKTIKDSEGRYSFEEKSLNLALSQMDSFINQVYPFCESVRDNKQAFLGFKYKKDEQSGTLKSSTQTIVHRERARI